MDELNMQEEEFWRQLEWLARQFIASKLNVKISDDDFALTGKRKDGGFDGQLIINIAGDDNVYHKILFESKFRTTIKSLPFTDCAKALIIAFNQAAQTLYIVTNVLFAPQSKEEIDKFKHKVNLTVIMVDGTALKEYVAQNKEALFEQCSEEFLHYIETSSDIDLDIKIDKLNEQTGKKTSKRKRRSVRNTQTAEEEYLYRNSLFDNESKKYIENVNAAAKFTLLSGEAGIGKTVFLTETLNTLEKQGYSTTIFDLQQFATPRTLFIKLLESLWEIDLSELIAPFDYEEGTEDLKSLIAYNSGGKVNENLLSAVTQAICRRTEEIKGYTDNYYSLLTSYIYFLLKPYKNNNKIVWAFTDLNKAGIETLDFLYTLLCRIQGIISVIVEMRPGFILETVSSELVKCNYYDNFTSISNMPYAIKLIPFGGTDAQKYLKEYLPDLPVHQLDVIIKKVGTLPLYLNTTANYIKTQIQHNHFSAKAIPDRILEEWISEFEEHGNSTILNSLRYFYQDSDVKLCIHITAILDGCLPVSIIEKLYESEKQTLLFTKLDNIFFYKFKGNAYYVKHDYIYDAINEDMSDHMRVITARQIYNCALNPDIDFTVTEEKTFELLFFMQEYEKALEQWCCLEKILYKQHLFCSIIKYGNIALTCYDNLQLTQRLQDVQVEIIISVLNAYLQIRILNAKGFHELLSQYETICNMKKYFPERNLLRARLLFYKWNQFFYGADIEESYSVISEAKEIIDEKNIDDAALCANIYWAYALSHKRKTSIQQAIEDYEEGLKKYPESTILNVGLKLHQAHTFLRKQPEKSCEICEGVLEDLKEDDCPYHEILQIRVDIVMSKFYAGQYTDALEKCEEVLQIARSVNASYQMGRLYNIYASILLMLGDIDEAEAVFSRAYHEFQESGNHLFAWRAGFNLSQVLLMRGKEKEAVKRFKALYNNEIPNLKERVENLSLENAELTAVLSTVRILKEKGLYKENEISKLLQSNETFARLSECDNETFYKELDQLSYMHKGCLIILG